MQLWEFCADFIKLSAQISDMNLTFPGIFRIVCLNDVT